ncbi:uncharacterized protein LOC123523577 [Mercenaria mercenaria]|uniref:uncharacterized protein LOC123523577 n=1 Tax=Mercenaria mercenaria TaxID=6596 RepID=UPI00234ED769|nr:uncharacterized protein LOC123523577 [Mercenaria mercenaria]
MEQIIITIALLEYKQNCGKRSRSRSATKTDKKQPKRTKHKQRRNAYYSEYHSHDDRSTSDEQQCGPENVLGVSKSMTTAVKIPEGTEKDDSGNKSDESESSISWLNVFKELKTYDTEGSTIAVKTDETEDFTTAVKTIENDNFRTAAKTDEIDSEHNNHNPSVSGLDVFYELKNNLSATTVKTDETEYSKPAGKTDTKDENHKASVSELGDFYELKSKLSISGVKKEETEDLTTTVITDKTGDFTATVKADETENSKPAFKTHEAEDYKNTDKTDTGDENSKSSVSGLDVFHELKNKLSATSVKTGEAEEGNPRIADRKDDAEDELIVSILIRCFY